jgi:hypothetical protein
MGMPDLYVSKEEVVQPVKADIVVKKDDKQLDAKARGRERVRQVLERTGERKQHLMFHSYVVKPEKRFISEQDDEEVVLLLRAHPITNIGWIMLGILMLALPTVLSLSGVFELVAMKYVFMAKMSWYLLTLGMLFQKFLNWYYSVFIVTNERIVDIDFENLLYRVVSYANLNHIEEPSMVAGGFIRSIFRYGDVFVATAAETGSIEGLGVPYPDRVIRIISELSEELEKERNIRN